MFCNVHYVFFFLIKCMNLLFSFCLICIVILRCCWQPVRLWGIVTNRSMTFRHLLKTDSVLEIYSMMLLFATLWQFFLLIGRLKFIIIIIIMCDICYTSADVIADGCPYDEESQCTIRLDDNSVVCLRAVNRYLALVCQMPVQHYRYEGCIVLCCFK